MHKLAERGYSGIRQEILFKDNMTVHYIELQKIENSRLGVMYSAINSLWQKINVNLVYRQMSWQTFILKITIAGKGIWYSDDKTND